MSFGHILCKPQPIDRVGSTNARKS
jgi:hypothetical protein